MTLPVVRSVSLQNPSKTAHNIVLYKQDIWRILMAWVITNIFCNSKIIMECHNNIPTFTGNLQISLESGSISSFSAKSSGICRICRIPKNLAFLLVVASGIAPQSNIRIMWSLFQNMKLITHCLNAYSQWPQNIL